MIVIGGLKLFAARLRPFVSLNNRCDTNYLLLMNIEKEEHNLLNWKCMHKLSGELCKTGSKIKQIMKVNISHQITKIAQKGFHFYAFSGSIQNGATT